MKGKQIISWFLASLLIMSLSGCGRVTSKIKKVKIRVSYHGNVAEVKIMQELTKEFKGVLEAIKYIVRPSSFGEWAEIYTTIIDQEVDLIMMGKQTLEGGIKNMVSKTNQFLENLAEKM